MSQAMMGTPPMGGAPQNQQLYGRMGPQMGPGQIQQAIQNIPQGGGGMGWGAGRGQFPQGAMPQGSFSGPGGPGAGAYQPGSFSAGVAALNRGSPFAGAMLNNAAGLPPQLGMSSSQGQGMGGFQNPNFGYGGPPNPAAQSRDRMIQAQMAGGASPASIYGAYPSGGAQNPLGITPQMQQQIRGSFPQMGGGMPQFAMPQRPFSPLAGEGYRNSGGGAGQIPNLQPMAGRGAQNPYQRNFSQGVGSNVAYQY